MRPSLRYAALSGYLQLSRSYGVDPATLMRAVDLDPADLSTPDKWVPAVRVARLLELSARACGRADFGLRLAEYRRLSTLGPLSLALRAEDTLRDALGLLMRYEHTYNEAIRIRLVEAEGLASLRMWLELGEPAPTTQAEQLAVGALHGIVSEVLGPRWQPLSACFSHAAPADVDTHTRLFGPRVRFGHSFTGLVLYASDLDAPNVLAGSQAAGRLDEIFASLAISPGLTVPERVRDLVEVLLPTGRCGVERVARTLGMDRRTLHRHLTATGNTFTSMVDDVRAGLAERYLSHERYRLTEISELLGFAAPSAFSRWFRHRFGDSPRRWRARRAELPTAL
ncbi:AraC family transcriptional regulator [Couchioplanes azureus]|uniref:AraC family transcriptional regulator n=1 Tax=Couchioplanes caeruleus TaxID=56438 RepID=UPI0016715F2A|nr:AraC family transcriptional regulator [Couchioplanes caeruleus]GGQ82726.1 putative transcriptional regulatory, AraC family protein [Couchioplanes caeruleus subsp. azureus]